jgi:L-alanine-DL-glutamate epimerase-like enolase superfamily enzyme
MRNWIFVRVDTDVDGLFGWGEATCEWKTRAVAWAIEDLQPLVTGRDPRDICHCGGLLEAKKKACAAHPLAPEVQHAATHARLNDGTVVDW